MKRGSRKVLDCEFNLVKYPFWGQESDQIAKKARFEKNNFLHPSDFSRIYAEINVKVIISGNESPRLALAILYSLGYTF